MSAVIYNQQANFAPFAQQNIFQHQPVHQYAQPQQAYQAPVYGNIMQGYMQPVQNWFNQNIGKPIAQFGQQHPVIAGGASAAAAGFGMAAMTGCPYAGASAAVGAAAPYMQQMGNSVQDIWNKAQKVWSDFTRYS